MDQLTFCFEGQDVRFVGTVDNPEWVAKDVCVCLGLQDTSKAVETLEPADKGTKIVRTPSGDQEMLTVTESGLYALVFKSRKPESKRFKRWVFEEVLPSIRKTGSYSITPLSPTQALIQALQLWEQIQEEQQRQAVELAVTKALAEQTNQLALSTDTRVNALELELQTLKSILNKPIPACRQTARQRIVEIAQLTAEYLYNKRQFASIQLAIQNVWSRINLKIRNSSLKMDLAARKSNLKKQYKTAVDDWVNAGKPKGQRPSKKNYPDTIPALIESLAIEQPALECTVSVANELVS